MRGLNLRYSLIVATLTFCSMWQYGYVLSYVNTAEDGFRHFLNQSNDQQLTLSSYGYQASVFLSERRLVAFSSL